MRRWRCGDDADALQATVILFGGVVLGSWQGALNQGCQRPVSQDQASCVWLGQLAGDGVAHGIAGLALAMWPSRVEADTPPTR